MRKQNYCTKTLDALSGGDDKIYVILDDRDDVWRIEGNRVSNNLHQIPPYFYWAEPRHHLFPFYIKNWFSKCLMDMFMVGDCIYDLDITLPIYLLHLKEIHSQFYKDFTTKDDSLKDTKYYIRQVRTHVFKPDKVVSFEKLIPLKKEIGMA